MKLALFVVGLVFVSQSAMAEPVATHQGRLKTLRPYSTRLQERVSRYGASVAASSLLHEKSGQKLMSHNIDTAISRRTSNPSQMDEIIAHETMGIMLAETVHKLDQTGPVIWQSGIVDGFIEQFENATGDKKEILAMMIISEYNIQACFDHLTSLGWTEETYDAFFAPERLSGGGSSSMAFAMVMSVGARMTPTAPAKRIGGTFRGRH